MLGVGAGNAYVNIDHFGIRDVAQRVAAAKRRSVSYCQSRCIHVVACNGGVLDLEVPSAPDRSMYATVAGLSLLNPKEVFRA